MGALEIFVPKKPRVPKFWGFSWLVNRYENRMRKWRTLLPKNGDKIILTWLPDASNVRNGTPNAYIGMSGIVEHMETDGSFCLNTGSAILICNRGTFKYKRC